MARLASAVKNGFYPCPPPVIELILKHLSRPVFNPASTMWKPDDITIFDPCAGEGEALCQLALGLEIPAERVYACELNSARAARLKAACPNINLLGPCSYFSSRISAHTMSLVYLNPPFDDELGGGGREEVVFLRQAAQAVALGGVLCMVLPLDQVFGRRQFVNVLDTYFENIEVYLFPKEYRRFKECVVFAKRRKSTVGLNPEARELGLRGWEESYLGDEMWDRIPKLGEFACKEWIYTRALYCKAPDPKTLKTHLDVWQLPFATPPRTFIKTGMTEDELNEELSKSPLYQILDSVQDRPFARPPLSLNKGHTSILLLTGLLDGYVASDPPHVVRGYCGKQSAIARKERYTTDSGNTIEKTVFAELPYPIVRLAWPDGRIETRGVPESSTATIDLDQAVVEDDDE